MAGEHQDDQRLAIYAALRDSEAKAWEALSGYKFWMFGYHAARWVNYNQLLPPKLRFRSPFKSLVETGARQVDKAQQELPMFDLDTITALPLLGSEGDGA